MDHQTGKTLVGKEHVGAVAQQVPAHAGFGGDGQSLAELLFGFGAGEQSRRAADTEGGVPRQGLLLGNGNILPDKPAFHFLKKLLLFDH